MPTTRVADLVTIASRLSGISEKDILGKTRFRHIARVRQAVMHIAEKQGVHSLPQIGRALNRDHSTVLHGSRIAAEIMRRDQEFALFVENIKQAASEADPFIKSGKPEFLIPPPRRTKPSATLARKPILPTDAEDGDNGIKFHQGIANGSRALLAALQA